MEMEMGWDEDGEMKSLCSAESRVEQVVPTG